MSFTWRTYKVKKDDTLQSVARELGINIETLKWHHNNYCPHELLFLRSFYKKIVGIAGSNKKRKSTTI
nr:LysM domain-containing protein [Flavobacterium covae]